MTLRRGVEIETKGQHVAIWLRRLFWAGLLALHAAPVAAAWNDAWAAESDSAVAGQIRLAMLLGSVAFFILKLVDVHWLRLPPGRQSTIAALMVIGLLHVGVIDRAAGLGIAYGPQHLGIVLFIGGSVCTDAGRQLRRHFALGRPALAATIIERVSHLWAIDRLTHPPLWVLALTATGPRAPPPASGPA